MASWTSTDDDKPLAPAYRWTSWVPGVASGLLLGVGYGVFFRLMVGLHLGRHSGEMTLAFLLLGPFAVGFLSCYPSARLPGFTLGCAFLLSSAAMIAVCVATALFNLEGTICIVMLLPIGLILSFLGGQLAYIIGPRKVRSGTTAMCVAVLPIFLALLEAQHVAAPQLRTVESEITIHASPDAVWQQIQSVPPIAPDELRPAWTHRIGFPRPIAATLSRPGVGGVRTATFEHSLTFFETVTTWEPDRRLAFSIKADTAHIPPTTLDEHVTIGGPYFDVLDGEYTIESRRDGVLLRLVSHQRLSTDVNGYAGLWTDAVMQNLQTSILQVIQHRSEATAAAYNRR